MDQVKKFIEEKSEDVVVLVNQYEGNDRRNAQWGGLTIEAMKEMLADPDWESIGMRKATSADEEELVRAVGEIDYADLSGEEAAMRRDIKSGNVLIAEIYNPTQEEGCIIVIR